MEVDFAVEKAIQRELYNGLISWFHELSHLKPNGFSLIIYYFDANYIGEATCEEVSYFGILLSLYTLR
ncbi:hypothetical protein JCM17380_09750 [Desulfosporosinus burensis]